jgi:pilus assembly protein CpaD
MTRNPVALAALALAGLALTACAENDGRMLYDPEQAHEIRVERSTQTRAVDVSDVDLVINASDLPQLDAFIGEFLRRGDGTLEISVAVGAGGEAVARERAETLMHHAIKRGVRRDEIRVRTHQPSAQAREAGPIVLSYDSYRAIAPRCGDFSVEVAHNYPNVQHRNLGCSIQAAMAAQISNPADLLGPRRRQPSDTARKNLVLQHHRAGEPTPAELSPREEQSSIRQLSQ